MSAQETMRLVRMTALWYIVNAVMVIRIATEDLPDFVPMRLRSNRCARSQLQVFAAWAVFETEAVNYSHAPISVIKIFA